VAIATGFGHTCALRVNGGPVCWGRNAEGQLGDGTTTDRLTPITVPSFLANVDGTADLASNGHRVLLTALVNCPIDHKVTIEMTLAQDEVTGHGRAVGKCTGALTEYPVQVSVRQGAPFELGSAQAEITATVREGHKVVDVQEWSRQVEIVSEP
jgi:alpha-tubulin suppressor-like RCC1 family protein